MIRSRESEYIYNKLYFGIMFITILDMHSKYIVCFPLSLHLLHYTLILPQTKENTRI